MSFKRGDVVLARFPHAAGSRGKKRPVVVVQGDVYNPGTHTFLVAEISTNLGASSDPANLVIDISTPEGRATGLRTDSLVTCLYLATIHFKLINRRIGSFSASLLQKLDACLKAALGLP
jgi:mRNA interferase MazF